MSEGILGGGFNADEVEPSTGFDAIPAGKYRAVITATDEKKTKAGTGSYLQITFTVTEGEYENRKLWARLNLNNPNDQAVGIARAELSALCRAVGVRQIKDPSQLHDLPILIRVTAKADDSGELRNEIKGYESVTATATKPTAGKQTAGAASSPPWKR